MFYAAKLNYKCGFHYNWHRTSLPYISYKSRNESTELKILMGVWIRWTKGESGESTESRVNQVNQAWIRWTEGESGEQWMNQEWTKGKSGEPRVNQKSWFTLLNTESTEPRSELGEPRVNQKWIRWINKLNLRWISKWINWTNQWINRVNNWFKGESPDSKVWSKYIYEKCGVNWAILGGAIWGSSSILVKS